MTDIYKKAWLLLSLTALFWAGNTILGRAVATDIPAAALTAVRWGLATLLLFAFAWRHLYRDWPILKAHWSMIVFLAIVGPGIYNTLSYLGLRFTTATNGLVLNAAGPSFIALAGWVFFGDRLSKTQLLGHFIGFSGVLFIICQGDLAVLTHFQFNAGDLLLAAANVIWAIYSACVRLKPAVSWQSFNLTTFAIATLLNIPFAILEQHLGYETHIDGHILAAIAYVAIFPSLLAYVFYNRAVELIGSGRAGIYMFLIPVFGALLAVVFLHERLALFHLTGFTLILTGVWLGGRKSTLAADSSAIAAKAKTL